MHVACIQFLNHRTCAPSDTLPNNPSHDSPYRADFYRAVITKHSPPNPPPKPPLRNMSLQRPQQLASTTTDEHTGGTTLSSLYGHYHHSPTSTWQSRTGAQHKRTGAVAHAVMGDVCGANAMMKHTAGTGARSPGALPPGTPGGVTSPSARSVRSHVMGYQSAVIPPALRSPPTLPPRAPRPLVVRPECVPGRRTGGVEGVGRQVSAPGQVYTPSFYGGSLSYGRTTSLLGLTPRPRRDVCEVLELAEMMRSGPKELVGKMVMDSAGEGEVRQGKKARPRGVYLPPSMSAPVFGSPASGPTLVYSPAKLASSSTGGSAPMPSSTGTRSSPCSPERAGQGFSTFATVEMGDEAGLDSTIVEERGAQRRMTPRK
ncbi:hypothetical protein BDZ85DRAFT_322953 [Elsinoe ampelina]|uniref:Uncharacterized protein n=1 Tax=Elsinoe ampelina TaxID=302913 RepID=A0A6A6FZE6_9PEZI|nr:hypothetical protein BDZ85DRAFT_322953 [Elsinoe ampelina]